MATYRITTFDGVNLPVYNGDQDISGAAVDSTLQTSIGGVFDTYGTRQRTAVAQKFTVAGIYAGTETTYEVDHTGKYITDHSGNKIITSTALGSLRGQVEAIRSRLGVRGTLLRKRWDDETLTQWRTARLLAVNERSQPKGTPNMAHVDCVFETIHPAWRSMTLATVTKNLVSGGLVGLNKTSGGTAPVRDATITVTASGTITALRITCTAIGVDLNWTGTMAAGQYLAIDCGAQTVIKSAVNAYSGFSLGSGHTARGWLPLASGINVLLISANGAGTVSISHYDQWV